MEFPAGEFDSLLRNIREGAAIEASQVLPFLILESNEDRSRVNLDLAESFYKSYERQPDAQSIRWAKSCIERALLLSRYAPEVLPLLIQINLAVNDIAAIAEALKRVGLERAAQGDFDTAFALFDRWAYAGAEFAKVDTHSFDPDILSSIERMSFLHRFEEQKHHQDFAGRKIRLAYLMQGLTEPNSVLVQIDQVFARLHDRTRFELAYFTVDSEEAVAASTCAQAAVKNIENLGYKVFAAPNTATLQQQLIGVGKLIHDFKPDILITSGGLATFKNYFITCLRPAPLTVAFHQGPTPQFSWHTFDHSISWFLTNFPDCPVNCSHVPLELELKRPAISPISRASLNIAADAILLVSGGRWPKFQGEQFWRAMIELLEERDDLYWLVIGVRENQVPFLSSLLTDRVRSRIIFQGWRADYLEFVAAADLLVDTYPSGGAVFLMEAMSLGIPTVSFKNDYIASYSNNDSSGGEEIVGFEELLVKRGDFAQLKTVVRKLANDQEYRRSLGEKCYERIHQTRGEPSRMVQRCEEVYEQLLANHCESLVDMPGVDADGKKILPATLESSDSEEYKVLLLERAKALNERESELIRREARLRASFLPRLRRGLHQVRSKLRSQ